MILLKFDATEFKNATSFLRPFCFSLYIILVLQMKI
jgi:hypothetical protein